ncbi:HTH-type transcriptional regulator CdhR [Saliniradius amylolyticus]|uniref:HTH-type transcriptional regulator CdhR n=1 Tax=Saliniradius amylolyticus TaxID=2183582 RepID=A0A2S2E860_9ALTE|nr:helix-turn-helix domain-containing protein [Saliniradius amylolyticus]AWL13400.1 HTH-type transcriptional regulator CdhR [Saliniradius amylolyticus]
MLHIALLVTPNAIASDVMSVIDFFDMANSYWRFQHPEQPEPFSTAVYSASGAPVRCSNGISFSTLPLTALDRPSALVVVPAYADTPVRLDDYLREGQALLPVLRECAKGSTLLVSHCVGSFILAEAGLLDGFRATTTWWLKQVFSDRYPKVELTMESLVLNSNNRITGGATTASINVCMVILETLMGHGFAASLSKLLLLDRQRLSQQTFIDPRLVVSHKDSLVRKVQDWMQNHYAEEVSLKRLSEEFAVTSRTLIRRFKAATGETPMAYLQQLRIEHAKELLAATDMPVDWVVERVGYKDAASFRRLFQNQTQLSPSRYRQRFDQRGNGTVVHEQSIT